MQSFAGIFLFQKKMSQQNVNVKEELLDLLKVHKTIIYNKKSNILKRCDHDKEIKEREQDVIVFNFSCKSAEKILEMLASMDQNNN